MSENRRIFTHFLCREYPSRENFAANGKSGRFKLNFTFHSYISTINITLDNQKLIYRYKM